MNLRSKLVRAAAIVFSSALLAGYVVYSHVTPNTPPPDLLGVNEVEAKLESTATVSSSIAEDNDASPSQERSRSDLRIISSKVINQPVFRVAETRQPMAMPEVRVATADFKAPGFRMVKDLEVVPGPGGKAAMPFDSFLKPAPDPLQHSDNIERIMSGDFSSVVREGRMLTPEVFSADHQRVMQMRRMMMSGSKSGTVRFDSSPWPDGPVLPRNPAPTVNP